MTIGHIVISILIFIAFTSLGTMISLMVTISHREFGDPNRYDIMVGIIFASASLYLLTHGMNPINLLKVKVF